VIAASGVAPGARGRGAAGAISETIRLPVVSDVNKASVRFIRRNDIQIIAPAKIRRMSITT
jgi:hypothetical protein